MIGKSPRLGQRQTLRPQSHWVPLGRAVVAFTITGSTRNDPEAKNLRHLTNSQIGEEGSEGASLSKITDFLKERTGAESVVIDPETGTFQFAFVEASQGAETFGASPWTFLENDFRAAAKQDEKGRAGGSKSGFVTTKENARDREKRLKAIQEAVGLVWRQFLMRVFDRAVASQDIILVARVRSVRGKYEALSPDTWPVLTVLDWQLGIARDPEGMSYYSIHAHPAHAVRSGSCRTEP
jgi:hypothetical protein